MFSKKAIIFFLGLSLLVKIYGEDPRAYQHGIDFVPRTNGQYYLIWASSGNPPTGPDIDENWTHDIYYSEINPKNPVINPVTIISRSEAQEPASSAETSDGNIMITCEDGWNAEEELLQRYGVYDNNFKPVNPYPKKVFEGGHSGHVASVGNRFVVFFSEEWIDGGGVDNLGSGDDVLLHVYNSSGIYERGANVSVGKKYRDWWPMIAGSTNHALLLWQRFVHWRKYVDLMYAIYDPATGTMVKKNTRIARKVKYYTYNVQYISSIKRFLIQGTYYSGDGFAMLIDNAGNITSQKTNLPGIVREAQPAVKNDGNTAYAVFPTIPNGIATLKLTSSSILLNNTISDFYYWSYCGTDGIFTSENSVYFVSLSHNGCVEKSFKNVIDIKK